MIACASSRTFRRGSIESDGRQPQDLAYAASTRRRDPVRRKPVAIGTTGGARLSRFKGAPVEMAVVFVRVPASAIGVFLTARLLLYWLSLEQARPR